MNLTEADEVDDLRRCFHFRKSERDSLESYRVSLLGNSDVGDLITDRLWCFLL